MKKITYTTDNNETIHCFHGQQALNNGHTLYLGFEQLTACNVCFWRDYYIQTARHGEALFLNNILNTYKLALADDIANATDHCLQYRSLADYDAFYKFVLTTDWDKEMPFYAPLFEKALLGFSPTPALSGFAYLRDCVYPMLLSISDAATCDFIEASTSREPRFIVYGSSDPITDQTLKKHCDHAFLCKTNFQSRFGFSVTGFGNPYAYYQEIVISVPYATDKKTPAFSHYGFIKNPWHAIDSQRLFSKTGAIVKGFSAHVSGSESSILGTKHYLTIHCPLRGVVKTLTDILGKPNIHVCAEVRGGWTTNGYKESYGESLLALGHLSQDNNAHWALKDPDHGTHSDYFICSAAGLENHTQGRIIGPDASLTNCTLIVVKSERLEIFYRDSGKILDATVMLRLLNYLKTHDQTGELPLGLAQEIAHAHKSSGVCAETLSLDAAISLYSDPDLDHAPYCFFSPSSHTGPTEKNHAAACSKPFQSL